MLIIKKIFFLLGESKKKLPFIIFFFSIISALDLAGIGIIGPYLSFIMSETDIPTYLASTFEYFSLDNKKDQIIFLSSVVISIFLIKTILIILIQKVIITFSHSSRVSLQSKLMLSYQSIDYENYLDFNSSDFINRIYRMSEDFAIRVLTPLLKAVSDLMVIVAILIFLLATNFTAFLVLAILFSSIFFIYDFFFKGLLKKSGDNANHYSKLAFQKVYEAITGLKEIRVLGKEDFFYDKTAQYVKSFAKNYSRQQILAMTPRYLLEFLMVLSIVVLVLLAMLSGQNVNTIFNSIAVFAVAGIRLIPAMNGMSSSMIHLRYHTDTVNKLYDDLKRSSPTKFQLTDIDSNFSFKSLELKDVSFSYKNSDLKVLKNINLKIDAGEMVGIVGASGSGKSTLIDIMLGLLEPSSGKILINDVGIENIKPSWLSCCAYIPQEIFIMDETFERNITLKDELPENMEDDFKKVIEMVDLSNVMNGLKNSKKTIIGERGTKLSGGQRQRISLARSLFNGRNVLFLDEATSALDTKTEERIIDSILSLRKEKTIIMIAHRLSTLDSCDKIINIEEGSIKEYNEYKNKT